MSCNLDLIISSVVLNYLNKIDKNIGNLFQKKTNALSLAKGSPAIKDVFSHFVQTNSKSRKIKFNAIGDAEHSTSEDEDIPQINLTSTSFLKPIKVETNVDGSESEVESSKKSDRDAVETDKVSLSKEVPINDTYPRTLQQNHDNNIAPEFYIHPNSSEPQVDQIMANEFFGNIPNFDHPPNRRNFDNYYNYSQNPERHKNKHFRGLNNSRKQHSNKNKNGQGAKSNKKSFNQGSKYNKKRKFYN